MFSHRQEGTAVHTLWSMSVAIVHNEAPIDKQPTTVVRIQGKSVCPGCRHGDAAGNIRPEVIEAKGMPAIPGIRGELDVRGCKRPNKGRIRGPVAAAAVEPTKNVYIERTHRLRWEHPDQTKGQNGGTEQYSSP